jgi:hypothetical protein
MSINFMSSAVVNLWRESLGNQTNPQDQTIGDSLLIFFHRVTLLCALAVSCFLIIACVWLVTLLIATAPLAWVVAGAVAFACILSVFLTVNRFNKRLDRYQWEQIELLRLELHIQKARIERESLLYSIPPKPPYPDYPPELSELTLRKKELDLLARRVDELLLHLEELTQRKHIHL